jgi:hypothetical protein
MTRTSPDQRPSAGPWPKRRGTESAIRARFGEARADLLACALRTGDPLADAVAAEIHSGGEAVSGQLRQGINQGLSSLRSPVPAVAALLTQIERKPTYIDDKLLSAGSRTYYSVAPLFHQIVLSVGSLVNVYASPAIANVLVGNGKLVESTQRRVMETGDWLITTMLPGTLRPGGSGYVATIEVRMLHANVRWAQTRHGYDSSAFGVPISQADLARTWLDFTYTSCRALNRLGVGFTAEEFGEIYRLWWYLGHLLGIDPNLYRNITSQHDAAELHALLDATNEPPTQQSAQLTEAVLGVVASGLADKTNLPPKAARSLINACARRIHDKAKADSLGIPHSPFTAVLPLLARRTSRDRAMLRRQPEKWAQAIEKNMNSARGLLATLDEPTTCQASFQPR